MYTDDDDEMQRKIRSALKSQLVSTYGSDFLAPEASRERAAQLRAAYGAEAAAAGSAGRGDSAGSTKQTDYRDFGSRPAELVNSRTRYGARNVQVPKFESGVLPREAVSNTYLGPNAQQQGHHQTTYKSEISAPGGGRMQGRGGAAAAEADLIRWRHPQWEGPVGPVAKSD